MSFFPTLFVDERRPVPPIAAISAFIGLLIVVYIVLSDTVARRRESRHHLMHPDALVAHLRRTERGQRDHELDDETDPAASLFLSSRYISSTAWSSPSGHHVPNVKRLITSASGASDFGASDIQEYLRQVLSVSETGETRTLTATVNPRYAVEVSTFLRPEHAHRVKQWWINSHAKLHPEHHNLNAPNVDDIELFGVDTNSGAVTILKDIPWNLAQGLAVCELAPILSMKTVTCSAEARLLIRTLHELVTKTKFDVAAASSSPNPFISAADGERIMRRYFNAGQLADIRYILSGATSKQTFHAVFNDGTHFATSAIGLGEQMCDGSRSGTHRDFGRIATQSYVARSFYNHEVYAAYGATLAELLDGVTESSTSPAAEELLLKKVKIWNPFRAHVSENAVEAVARSEEGSISQRESMSLAVLFRPTLMCVMMTSFGDGLKLAMLQFLLWGDLCDDFLIVVASSDANGPELLRKSYPALQKIARIKHDHMVHVRMSSDDVRRNLWTQFQLALGAIDERGNVDAMFQYYYIATDDTFMIPENLYDMLLQPEWFTLHAASTPLVLGNAMWEPQEQVVYASAGPGVVINNVAMRLALSAIPSDKCRPRLVSNAWDVLLAKCLHDTMGILVRDTVDEVGESRFHTLSLHWLLLAPTLPNSIDEHRRNHSTGGPSEGWWYDIQNPRKDREFLRTNPFRAVSSGSIAFNKVNTPEKAIWMHMQLRHGG